MKLALLVLLGYLYGLLAAVLFRRFVHRDAVRVAANRMIAHVLEFRLFIDEPMLVFRAQRDLVLANVALIRLMAVPLLVTAVLFAAAYVPLNRYFGVADLKPGEVALAHVESTNRALSLVAPFGVAVESPPLRIPRENATYWRIRAMAPVNGEFRTAPNSLPVMVRHSVERYLGFPWLAVFGVVSALAALGRSI